MRIDLLCSGSKGNSCLVRNHDSQILIDCGSTKKYLKNAFKKVKAHVQDCDGVLITHTHKDHVSQIKHVSKLPIYSYCDIENIEDHHIVKPLETFMVGSFKITVIGLSHDAPKTVGYVVETEGEKLVYITDTGYLPNREKPLLTNADYYIFESNHDIQKLMQTKRPMFIKQRILSDNGHLNNEDSSVNLSQLINTNTKDIILAHLSQEANHPQLAVDTVQNVFFKQDMPLHGVHILAAEQFGIETIGQDKEI